MEISRDVGGFRDYTDTAPKRALFAALKIS
jgi:hypothetical protein